MNLELTARHIIDAKAEKIVQRIEKTLIAEAPVYTGKVKRSIRTDRVNEDHWVIAPHTDHDYWAEYGNHANSSDGRIHPTKKKRLKWVDKYGKTHYADSVRPHEGSHFVRNTVMKYK